jgi:hypothetical protein
VGQYGFQSPCTNAADLEVEQYSIPHHPSLQNPFIAKKNEEISFLSTEKICRNRLCENRLLQKDEKFVRRQNWVAITVNYDQI